MTAPLSTNDEMRLIMLSTHSPVRFDRLSNDDEIPPAGSKKRPAPYPKKGRPMKASHPSVNVPSAVIDCVVKRLGSYAPLSPADVAVVRGLAGALERHAAGDKIVEAGRRKARPRCIVSGWACCVAETSDGQRQIFRFVLPGDVVGLSHDANADAHSSIVALTQVQTIDAAAFGEVLAGDRKSVLARALDAAIGQETVLMQDQIIRLGRLNAIERLAHLLLELRERLAAVGMATDNRLPLPVTQEVLADALGLSNVHLNRSLQQMRRERLIEVKRGAAVLLQPQLLENLCRRRGRSDAGQDGGTSPA